VCIAQYPLAVVLDGANVSRTPVIVADRFDRGHVIALDDRAYADGARIGQTVAQASAAVWRARIAVYDPARGHAQWIEMLDALDAATPLIDDVRDGIAFLDMRGIAGDVTSWMAHVRETLAPFGMPLRLGCGTNKFCAYAASWIGDGTILDGGDEAARLNPLPLEVLELDPSAQERLRLLGIATLGELAALPHGPFVRRFGRNAARWHEWARGIDRTPFIPRGHAVTIEASLLGEGQADDEAQVFFALRVLLTRICSDLERCGKRASALELRLDLEDAEQATFDVLFAAPTADERSMLDVLRAKLEGVQFQAPIVGLQLRALRLEEGGEEMALFAADEIDGQHVAVTLARLEAVLGEPALRARLRDAHPLEERFTYEPFSVPKRDAVETPVATVRVAPQLRLLSVREIDVRMVRGEPAFIGSPPQAVLECAGPWRIDEGWFGSAVSRDEYDVVVEDGEIYRIYRQGTRWYLRGAYD
jgi:protein ImuB